MKKNKEIPIGGIGIIDNIRVMAKEYTYKDSCDQCCFSLNADYHFPCPEKKCSKKYRLDKRDVYFVETEKGADQ